MPGYSFYNVFSYSRHKSLLNKIKAKAEAEAKGELPSLALASALAFLLKV
jgi:hypothetical protein